MDYLEYWKIFPVRDMPLTVRLANVLTRARFQTVADIISRTESELLKLPKMGKVSYQDLMVCLSEIGCTYKPRV